MNQIKKLILGIFTLSTLLLSGCNSVKNVPINYNLNSNSDKGVLLTSLTYHGGYSGYSMRYRKVGSKDWSKLKIGSGTSMIPPGMLDWDIEKPGLRGNLFAVELEKGDYEFSSWSVSSGPALVLPVNTFSIKFKILPAQALYIGNFHFLRESSIGATVTGVNVSYNDELKRDIPLINKKYSSIDPLIIKANTQGFSSINRLGDGNSTSIFLPIIQ
ncbi:hypothetical protein [Amphritea sp.]|uniref:hypothetical protein n=1 Tax=Amphritea sp. TaxID=1872502 RepID=UPI0025C33B34|nr:hypothetical protein [Amphritea sp.]